MDFGTVTKFQCMKTLRVRNRHFGYFKRSLASQPVQSALPKTNVVGKLAAL